MVFKECYCIPFDAHLILTAPVNTEIMFTYFKLYYCIIKIDPQLVYVQRRSYITDKYEKYQWE